MKRGILGCIPNQVSQMSERQKGLGEFVVARGDAPEWLDGCEQTLAQFFSVSQTLRDKTSSASATQGLFHLFGNLEARLDGLLGADAACAGVAADEVEAG